MYLKPKITISSIFLIIISFFFSGGFSGADATELVIFNDDDLYLNKNIELNASYYEVYKTITLDDTGENLIVGPSSLAFDGANNRLMLGDYLKGNIYLYSLSSYKYAGTFGPNRKGLKMASNVNDIYVSPKSGFYALTDRIRNRVLFFNNDQEAILDFGKIGESASEFNEPGGMDFDGENFFISDRYNCRICVYDKKGLFKYSFSSKGQGPGQLYLPGPLLVNGSGEVYVCDSGNDRIEAFDKKGKFIRTIGRKGRLDGEFNNPTDICFDSNGNLYVADSFNSRVQKFDGEGGYICQIKELTSSFMSPDNKINFLYKMPQNLDSNEINFKAGSLVMPIKIDIDNKNAKLFVLDSGLKKIIVFDSDNFNKARTLYFSRDFKNAIKYLKQTIVDSPINVNAMFYVSHSLMELSQKNEAYEYLCRITESFPKSEAAKYARYYIKKLIATEGEEFESSKRTKELEKFQTETIYRKYFEETSEMTIFDSKRKQLNIPSVIPEEPRTTPEEDEEDGN